MQTARSEAVRTRVLAAVAALNYSVNPQARSLAPFPLAHEVLDEDSHDRLAALPKDTPLAFLCRARQW